MRTEIKYSLIFVILSFIWNYIEYITGLQTTHINLHPIFVTSFFILLTVLIFLIALREKRSTLGGKITFGKAITTGIIISLFIFLLNPIFLYAFYTFINPNFFHDFSQYEILSGKSTKEEAENYYTLENFIIRGSIYKLIMGIIASFIISIFLKKSVTSHQ